MAVVLAALIILLVAKGFSAVSARSRELFYLGGVGLLTGIGFASVYIARQALVSWGSLTYAALFIGLYLVAHLAARATVPNADPYLLPMTGLMTAVGLTEIYRLGPSDAFHEGMWIVIGVVGFAGTLIALRHDYRVLESYKYLFGVEAIALLFLPRLPGIGLTVNGGIGCGCTPAGSRFSRGSSRRSS